MINLFYISTEIFLSLSILILLLIGVFKNKSELFILTLLALGIIFFGFYPDPFSNTYSVSVENFLNEYNDKINSYNFQNQ